MIRGHWQRGLMAGCLALGFCGVVLAEEKAEKPAASGEKKAESGENKGKGRRQYLDKEHAPKRREGWVDLFNRKDLTGWKKRDANAEMSWKVEDGILKNEIGPGKHGVDLISEQKFDDYEIYYEYKLPKDSNSGMYLRGRYEVQILEDFGKPATPESNGGIYSLTAPSKNVTKPAGEWQSAYVSIQGRKVNVWLNGTPPRPVVVAGLLTVDVTVPSALTCSMRPPRA